MIYKVIRWWATIFLRLYFRRVIVHGMEHIPPKGPLIVASNHPSAFLEASILGIVLNRPLHFLVRGDMFHPRFQWLFDWTNQIPIYRRKDGISNLRKNASSFELTYRKLGEGAAVVIFPEAKTILEKRMRPIQRGTAHLAFGTLPFLSEGDQLPILPVGVNFTEPRLPGTDVVIRFGQAFNTMQATREDRDLIEEFTDQLSNRLSPLIIQVVDEKNDLHYDVLASIYMQCMTQGLRADQMHDGLYRIARRINQSDGPSQSTLQPYIKKLKQAGLDDAIYFPGRVLQNRISLFFQVIFKLFWLISGGWIWRGARNVIFSKIKPNTFKSPVTVGAAMVIYPLVTLLLFMVCLIGSWPLWIPLAWLIMMASGILVRPSLGLIWKIFSLKGSIKKSLKHDIAAFRKELQAIVRE